MTLLRAGARTLLASYFVVSGFKAVRHPAELVPAAQPLTDKVVPLVKQYAPAQLAAYIPEDTTTLVRINGAAQLFGGLALATGKGRRFGATLLAASLIPSTLAKHPFWSRDDAEQKAIDKAHFLKNASLLGGVILASRDTEGKPGIAWRAQKAGHELGRSAGLTSSKVAKTGSKVAKTTSALADSALAEGAALAGVVVASTRKARKAAAKQTKGARKAAAKAAEQARKDAKKFAKKAKKEAPKQLAAARKEAAKRAEELSKQVAAARKEAAKQAEIARKQTAKQLAGTRKDLGDAVADAKKSVGNAVSHISLGEN